MHRSTQPTLMPPRLTGRTLPAALTAALILCLAAPQAAQAATGGDPATGIEWTVTADGSLEVTSSEGTTVVITCEDSLVRVNGHHVWLPDSLGGGRLPAAGVTALTVRNTSPSGDAATTFDLSGVTADCFTALTQSNIHARVDYEIEDTDNLIESPIVDPLGVANACGMAMPAVGLVTFVWLMASRVRRTRP